MSIISPSNVTVVLGRICNDIKVETRNGANGSFNKATFTIAVPRQLTADQKQRKQNGENIQDADFLPCSAIGSTADFISKYFVKGKPISALLSYNSYSKQNQDGTTSYGGNFNVVAVDFVPKDTTDQNNQGQGQFNNNQFNAGAGQFVVQNQGQGNFYAQNNQQASNNNVANFGAPQQINQPSPNNNVANFGAPPQINQQASNNNVANFGTPPQINQQVPQGQQPVQQTQSMSQQPIQQNAIPQGQQPIQQNAIPQGQQPVQQGGYNPSAVGNTFPPSGDSVF